MLRRYWQCWLWQRAHKPISVRQIICPDHDRWTLERLCSLDAELAKKGRLYERNQYFPRSPNRAVHDPAAPQDAQPETTDRRVRNTKDVSLLRIDHISIEGMLLGVRQACYSGGVFDCKEMNTAHLIVARRRIEA